MGEKSECCKCSGCQNYKECCAVYEGCECCVRCDQCEGCECCGCCECCECCGRKNRCCGWWSMFFVIDYVTCVVLLIVAVALKYLWEPYRMYVPTVNITVAEVDSTGAVHNVEKTIDIAQDRMYPAVPEALPTVVAGVVFGVVAVVVWAAAQLVLLPLSRRKWSVVHDLHNCALGMAESVSLLLCVVDILKPFAGRYRPRYLQIAAEAETSEDEWEGRVSYPSGHSGTAFSAMFFTTLYLLGKLRVFSRSGVLVVGSFLRVILAMLPTFGAFLCAITRTRDYMHNFSDINAGAIIGMLCATAAYHTVYPTLTSLDSQMPRSRAADSSEAAHKKDEGDGSPALQSLV